MNPAYPVPGGGGYLPNIPIWYPPMSVKWMATGLLLFCGAVANRFKPEVRALFTGPVGFFATAVLAAMLFQYGFPPLAFALLFVLLMMWSAQESLLGEGWIEPPREGFLNFSNTVDWVTRHKRW